MQTGVLLISTQTQGSKERGGKGGSWEVPVMDGYTRGGPGLTLLRPGAETLEDSPVLLLKGQMSRKTSAGPLQFLYGSFPF